MRRVNHILYHPVWQAAVKQIRELEDARIFCRHDIDHLLHVARIAYIENLEQKQNYAKELIYAAALLHDIGRGVQYTEGVPHEQAGVVIAPEILKDCGFNESESELVLAAIAFHRDASVAKEKSLRGLIYRADKMSRTCFSCLQEELCDWSSKKKVKEIIR